MLTLRSRQLFLPSQHLGEKTTTFAVSMDEFEKKKKQRLNPQDALEVLKKYCAYQDRCHSEVRTKILEYQVYGDALEEIISELISENFLNEERFAKSYVRGKFRMNKWGRIKIMQQLKFKKISDYCIKKGFKEIDEEEYYNTLVSLIEKKNKLLKDKNIYHRRKKLTSYAVQKGYEYPIIKEVLADLEI